VKPSEAKRQILRATEGLGRERHPELRLGRSSDVESISIVTGAHEDVEVLGGAIANRLLFFGLDSFLVFPPAFIEHSFVGEGRVGHLADKAPRKVDGSQNCLPAC
jgi:hypothetical protein